MSLPDPSSASPVPEPAAGPVPPASAVPGAPPPQLVRSPLSDGEWHRLHPLTPLLRGGLFLLVVIGIIVANLRDRLLYLFLPWLNSDVEDEVRAWEVSGGDPIDFIVANNLYLLAALAVLGALIVLVAVFYTSWRFHTFRITEDDVEVRSGILFRTQRRAPLDRVQGVNLTRPMIARLLGMAKLEVVGAGTDANVKLEYLSTANAEAVRADILRLASGRRLATAGPAAPGAARPAGRVATLGHTVGREITGMIEGPEAPVAEIESVVNIPVGRLVASHIVSMSTLGLLFAIVAIVVGVSQGVTWLLIGFVPAIIGFGAYWVRSIVRSLRYSIAPTPDGVRITFGLFTTITEIVPPGRVHAVEVTQPILWRPAGWWTIRINRLTGRSVTDSTTDQFTTVLPVGTAADVDRVLRLLQPSLPDHERALVVQEGMFGPGEGDTFTNTPKRAWWIRPLSFRRNGFRLTADVLLMRRGVVWRKLVILPLARLQSFGLYQGPLDRATRVTNVRAHVVTGPVSPFLAAVDRDRALQLFDDVAHGSVRAALADRTHRWAQDETDAAPPAVSPAPVAGAPAPVVPAPLAGAPAPVVPAPAATPAAAADAAASAGDLAAQAAAPEQGRGQA
ncbi:PH domain-containing protein [Microbacterium sp. M3]|uniref:PH domain-containing protein n=1 Tax=Microbacterium arthrosphaerae TaxID=792652 RepID=A0ABU4H2U3_9MICO|nr:MULTISPECIES: PH domain-containing protein [Microbacterium]MDW4573640.1 PH domain-containing protein [Microbacterium arthrosphaerae]MDW7607495.1 PH domain-containing protein [Microbacterium sp. M3]